MKNNSNKIVIYSYNNKKKRFNKELKKQWAIYNSKIKQSKFLTKH